MADVAMGRQQTSVRVGHPDDARQLRRFHSGDLLDRVQADIDSLDRVVLTVAGVVCAIVGAAGVAVLALVRPVFGGWSQSGSP
jgi:ABC-type transport system involved in cytochrome bd biosynthesis fused ATPase/permease subunit